MRSECRGWEVFAVLLALPLACGSSSRSSSDAGGVSVHDASGASRSDAGDAARSGDASDARPREDARDTSDAADARDGSASERANGSLGAWQTLTPMPLPRANHCAVAAGGYLVVIGGNYEPDGGASFVDIDAVHVAPLHADGSIGAWSLAGTTPSPVSGCTAAARGSTIYLIDGIYDDTSDVGQVFSADLSTAGVLGAWARLGPLPNGQDAFSSSAWFASDTAATLYVLDSSAAVTAALTVPTAPTLGSWSEHDWLPGFLGRPEYASTSAYVYAMGGYLSDDAGNPAVATVHGAPLEPAGGVGTPFVTRSLPMPITYGTAVSVDDWIFVVGGKPSIFASGEPNTLSSRVGTGGQLGAWTAQTPLPEGRTDMALTLAGNFLYVTGGGYMGPGVDTVFAARVR